MLIIVTRISASGGFSFAAALQHLLPDAASLLYRPAAGVLSLCRYKLNVPWDSVIKATRKNAGRRPAIRLFFVYQVFHGISILLYKGIHTVIGIHTLRIQLIFAVNKHRRNALQL
jgi:hypothetical protein